MSEINNINNEQHIIIPKELKKQLPLSIKGKESIFHARQTINNILIGKNPKLLIICGPCSVHNINEAIEYSQFLKEISSKITDNIYIVMRVYFEKPRTIIGWKGLINDPDMNNSFNINKGLYLARELLLKLVQNNIAIATEVLDPNITHYLGDLFSWCAIGARTTESQIHREIAASLNIPVGFKNNTDGSINSAINAIKAANNQHSFITINQNGKVCIRHTTGNKHCHVILRGGKIPNYYADDIKTCEKNLILMGLKPKIMIDCSHGNSNKNFKNQEKVVNSVISQIKQGNKSIFGLMLESYIHEGNQIIDSQNKYSIKYGISVTDECINLQTTENILHKIYYELKQMPLRFLS
ncbi:3-deoxy-7-phosphoheptulonate synthase [Enterobacteriaceae endosymbiont of Neohaemonia nigricornis]|uniref:3-deoxy-7-phosphoheptulonate synthase n=1 Tax=Enterobacteriaceae endosymbiont of Neohaemonia nigricornis TaxID=2675792 RepID=UPI001449B74D|nr:3-deoxy-7-phosphoheptulonate synthase [Enterobacteriaceae endosymbiont of Neohaemonia nigricornis]QJC30559.1 3-deoxy-7-phosphoheptulonate synthase [Enterobacteriaceae endosymbiont of Neohaemonia nigricornis]